MAFIRGADSQTLTIEEMRRFLREQQVTQQFWPEAVFMLDELPRTASGKIQKFVLREKVAEIFS